MLDILLSLASGGVTGILGTALSGVIDLFQRRQSNRQELELRRLDIELANAEGASAERVAAIEAEGERDQAEWEAMRASYREASARMSRPGDGRLMHVVDFVRGLTRPLLTWLHFWLVVLLIALVGAGVLAKEHVDLLAKFRIVETVLYLYTAAVLWWFGQRQIEKRRVQGLPWLR